MNHPLIEPLEARIAPAAVFTITAPSPNTVQEGNSGEKEVIFTVHLTEALATTATVT